MIKPNPFKLTCPNCNYSKVVRPKSDNLNVMDSVQHCPKCETLMKRTGASDKDNILTNIFNILFGK
jgi:transcription elongation factor Elf1